jgi:uncharacterized protein (TIGR04255 family)
VIGDLPTAPRFTLEHHQIAQVICHVRFSPVLRLQRQEEIARFQDEVRDRYPDFASEQAVAFLITPQGVAQQDTGTKNYRFIDRESGVMLVLSTDFVAIETRDYVEIQDVAARIKDAVDIVARLYEPATRLRLGLRFTNEFRFEAADLPSSVQRAFNPLLLGPAGVPELASVVEQTQSVIRLQTPDGTSLQVIHGLNTQGGTTVAPIPGTVPPPVRQEPFYLLDFDAFSEKPLPLNSDAVAEQVLLFNDQIRTLFAWATTLEYRRNVLGERAA